MCNFRKKINLSFLTIILSSIVLTLLSSCGSKNTNNGKIQYDVNIDECTLISDSSMFNMKVKIKLNEEKLKLDTLKFNFGKIPNITIRNLKIQSSNGKKISYSVISDSIKGDSKLYVLTKGLTHDNNSLLFSYGLNICFGASLDKNNSSYLLRSVIEGYIPIFVEDPTVIFNSTLKETLNKNYGLYSSLIHKCKGGCLISNDNIIPVSKVDYIFTKDKYFKIFSKKINQLDIHFYSLSKMSDEKADLLCTLLGDCIKYFSDNIYPFPYKKYTLLETNWSGNTSIGNASLVFSSSLESFVPFHELIHTWVGHIVKPDFNSTKRFLFSESLNEYLTMQFMRRVKGKKLYDQEIQRYMKLYKKSISKNHDKSILDVKEYKFSTHSIIMYKEVYLLDKLARKVGYDTLNNCIYSFLRSKVNKVAHTKEFLDYLEKNIGEEATKYRKMI